MAEAIGEEEVLYRRVPLANNPALYTEETEVLSPMTYHPHRHRDTAGISLNRAKYTTPEELAGRAAGKRYYIAALKAKDVFALGVTVVPVPLDGDPGHCEIPEMRADNRKSREVAELELALAGLSKVFGPYGPPPEGEAPVRSEG